MERVISKRKPQQDRSATHEPGTGYFKKGHKPIARGRPKGIPNRLSRDIRSAILSAAEQVGEDGDGRGGLVGYCRMLAKRHPKSFSHMLQKLIPIQVKQDGTMVLPVGKVTIVPIKAGSFLSNQQLGLMGRPMTIDGEVVNPIDDNDASSGSVDQDGDGNTGLPN